MAPLHSEYFEKSPPWDPHQQRGSLVRHLLSVWFFQRTPGPALAQTWSYVMALIKAGQPRLFELWLVGQDLTCLPNLVQKFLSFMELKTRETNYSFLHKILSLSTSAGLHSAARRESLCCPPLVSEFYRVSLKIRSSRTISSNTSGSYKTGSHIT